MNLFKIYGVMGCGKSTLTEALAKEFNASLWIEPFKENPFLPLFYKEMSEIPNNSYNKYGLPLQLFFLTSYMRQNSDILENTGNINIQDGGAFSGFAFTKTQYRSGMISKFEYEYFTSLFKNLKSRLDINYYTFYLDLDVKESYRRVLKRAKEDPSRSQETSAPIEYLEMLDECYKEAFEELEIPVEYVDVNGLSIEEGSEMFSGRIETLVKRL